MPLATDQTAVLTGERRWPSSLRPVTARTNATPYLHDQLTGCKRRHPSGALILKPCKFLGKGALRASLRKAAELMLGPAGQNGQTGHGGECWRPVERGKSNPSPAAKPDLPL
jgi:hypothetical protein